MFDGVLADFNHGLHETIIRTSGKDLFPPNWTPRDINCWYYTTEQYGYSKEEDKAAWAEIKKDPIFWYELPPLPGAEEFLKNLLTIEADVYFITNRVGFYPKVQTEEWLMRWGFQDLPTVLISEKKGDCCHALKISHYIDDKPENCKDVAGLGSTQTFMLAQGWNKETNDSILRIPTLSTFWDIIKDENGKAN